MGQKEKTFLLILLFILLLIPRVVHLDADPPYNLSWSGGPYGDPGSYNLNARNKILFGEYELDDFNLMYSSFPPHLISYAVFRLFGVGIKQQNIVPVLFSLLTLVFFYFILRKSFDFLWSVIGTLLLGFNYIFLMFSRIADRIMPMIIFIILGIYFLLLKKRKLLWHIPAGLSFGLALISKSVIFYALGAVLLGYLIYSIFNFDFIKIIHRFSCLLIGAMIVLIPWTFFIYIPKHEYILSFGELNSLFLLPPLDIPKIIGYFLERPCLSLYHLSTSPPTLCT